jgi:glucose/arabinose dehydrogenase
LGQVAIEIQSICTFRSSWNRDVPTGFKVMRIRFQGGYVIEDFVTVFLLENGMAQFGRLAGLAVDNQGALLIAKDTNGFIYQVSYEPTRIDKGSHDTINGGSSN